jgi:hypothetical protein
MTPEGRVKREITKVLKLFPWWTDMPVPTGYGKSQLDYTLCVNGRFVAIEAKAPGEWLTPLQRKTAREMLESGGKVFIVSNKDGLRAVAKFLKGEYLAAVASNSLPPSR